MWNGRGDAPRPFHDFSVRLRYWWWAGVRLQAVLYNRSGSHTRSHTQVPGDPRSARNPSDRLPRLST